MARSSSQMKTLNSSTISELAHALSRGLINPCAMTWGESVLRNSAILAMPWLMVLCSSFRAISGPSVSYPKEEPPHSPPGPDLVAEITLHVDRIAAQGNRHCTKFRIAELRAKLIVVARGDLEIFLLARVEPGSAPPVRSQ